jgi:hypothetical protein
MRFQATLVNAILLCRKNQLLRLLSSEPLPQGLTKADSTLLLISGNASQLFRILNSDLWHRINRIPPNLFRQKMRLLINLPPISTLGNPTFSQEHMANLDTCRHCNEPLDPTAKHAVACPTTRGLQARTHHQLVRTIARRIRTSHGSYHSQRPLTSPLSSALPGQDHPDDLTPCPIHFFSSSTAGPRCCQQQPTRSGHPHPRTHQTIPTIRRHYLRTSDRFSPVWQQI